MKKLKLRRWVKVVLVILVLVVLALINKKLDDDFMKSCTDAGFTKEYCEAHK